MPKVLVAMSGGVDSSVAAALLKDQGYEVIGATMQVWDYSNCDLSEAQGTCCSSVDVEDARSVADQLDIPFYVINCEEKFKTAVIDPFVEDYLRGKTPLPCVNCNTFLKFDHLIQKMKMLECDYLATGHYAQIKDLPSGTKAIFTSSDHWKDQTYFLFTIDPKVIPSLLFPVGHLNKSQVREIAIEKNLPVAKKKDSTGICFVGNKNYSEFIQTQVSEKILEQKKGFFRKFPSGEILGKHQGIHLYTYGQSKGLGLSHHEKMFVIKIDESNDVWLGEEKDLYQTTVSTMQPVFLDEISEGEQLSVKVRYSHKAALAKVKKTSKGLDFEFSQPQRAITPGQAAVFYRGQQLVGGSWIC